MAPELSASALARLAGQLGCQHLCLFTQEPAPDFFVPTVRAAEVAELRACMAGEGLSLYGATFFPIRPDGDVARLRPGVEIAAELGASYASTHIVDPDESRAADSFARLCEMARPLGIAPSIEFMALDEPETLERTLRIIAAAGAGVLSIDPLHLVRSGASLDRLRGLPADVIGYVQICDGVASATAEDYRREAGSDRLAPGEGVFPLAEIMAVVPPGRPISMEIPGETRRRAGIGAEARVTEALTATRRFLAGMAAASAQG